MQQVYGMKVIVFTRGDLTNKLGMLIITNNLYSDVRLHGQESAEAIVSCESRRRAERKEVFKV
ncbi:MAG: hypothetical protein E4H43_03095 [Bacteroidia bacterium]|nr:MAG: hypothetical protein E4H43_03095 [Bacteroidia bacterium]